MNESKPEEAENVPVEPEATLVPIDDDGGFLVIGELPESLGIQTEPVPYLREEQVRGMADVLASSAGIGNVLAQSWNAYHSSAGLVRLAPETLAAMRAGATPLTQNGWALGTLTKGGRFAAQIRWAPAGAAGVGAALATLGPALALVAVQWQLNKIGKAVERNIELTRTVLDELREQAWYELDAAVRVVLASARAAQAIGEVTDLEWQYHQAQSTLPVLLSHRQRNLDALSRKLDQLSQNSKVTEWYQRNYADVLRHSQAVMTAQQAIAMHHLLRAAHARRTGDPRDEALAHHIVSDVRSEHEHIAERIDTALRTLHSSLALWYEADPGKRLTVFEAKDVPLLDLRNAVADLHARAVEGPFGQLRPIGSPRSLTPRQCVGVADRDRPSIERRLRWVLEDDESLVLLSKGSYRFGDSRERHLLVVTERRAFLADHEDLMRGRATTEPLPPLADMTRRIDNGFEFVELQHEGRQGVLKTRSGESVVYEQLERLNSRLRTSSALDVPADRRIR